jgi:hypothetical protein
MASSSALLSSILQSEAASVQATHQLRANFVKEKARENLKFDRQVARAAADRGKLVAEESSDAVFPPKYPGRPISGFSSGALQLFAEHHRGAAPPYGEKFRAGFRDPINEGAILTSAYYSPALERSGGLTEERSGAVLTVAADLGALNPGMIRDAEEAIKQPQYLDRGFDLPLSARGDSMARKIAICADIDDAAQDENLFFAERERALTSILGSLPAKVKSSKGAVTSTGTGTANEVREEAANQLTEVKAEPTTIAAPMEVASEVEMAAPLAMQEDEFGEL